MNNRVLPAPHPEGDLTHDSARLRAVAELSPDILSIMDADGQLIYNSPAAERIHGYRSEDMLGRSTLEFIHPDDRSAVEAAFGRLLSDPSVPVMVTYRYRHLDGSWTWMEATGRNMLSDPRVCGIIAVSRDVSSRFAQAPADLVHVGAGSYHRARRVVVSPCGVVALTPAEARLLEYLAAHPGEVVTHERLLRDVWGYSAQIRSRTVYVTVERLRRKIEADPGDPRCLVSRAGLGYVFVPPGSPLPQE